jgi:hypothetical protein
MQAARNCMVSDDGEVVVGDLGLRYTRFEEDYSTLRGHEKDTVMPVRWTAPEVLRDAGGLLQHSVTISDTLSRIIWCTQ